MKVLLIGATGATGKDLLASLLEDENFSEVVVFVRKALSFQHPKLTVHQVDFSLMDSWRDLIQGDVAFSTIGTTLKQAGTKSAQKIVDYDIPYQFASYAQENQVKHFVLLSAYGANEKSFIFYSKIKGQLEKAIEKLNFDRLTIFQPGILERNNSDRPMEVLGLKIIRFFNQWGLFPSQKPLPTKILAKAMLNSSLISNDKVKRYPLTDIFELVKRV